MAFTINHITLLGNLGRDAEVKFTPNGKSVANFSVATTHSRKDANGEWQNLTDWTNVVMWGSEKIAYQLLKGTKVAVEGRLSTRSYDNKDGKKVYVTEVIADSVIPCGSNAAGASYDNGGADDSGDPF